MARHFLKIASHEASPTEATVTVALSFFWNQMALVKPNSSFGLITKVTP